MRASVGLGVFVSWTHIIGPLPENLSFLGLVASNCCWLKKAIILVFDLYQWFEILKAGYI